MRPDFHDKPLTKSMKSVNFADFLGDSGQQHRTPGGIRFGNALGNTSINAYENSAVAACLGWVHRNVGHAERKVYRVSQSGNKKEERFHPIVQLLKKPNTLYNMRRDAGIK